MLIWAPEAGTLLGQGDEHEVMLRMVEAGLIEDALIAVLLLLILGRVRSLLDSAISSDPFVSQNAQLLRQVGWLWLAINSARSSSAMRAPSARPQLAGGGCRGVLGSES